MSLSRSGKVLTGKPRRIPYAAYLYVLPMVVLMGTFIYYPIFVNFYYSVP